MDVTIRENAALDGATQIDEIVSKIDETLATLNSVMHECIPEEVNTVWSNEVLDNWESYYLKDVENKMAEMKASAVNLRSAVDAVVKYGKGK